MKFYRVYVELTNICGLACSFCPPKQLPTQTMSLPFFEQLLDQLRPYTKEIAYHMGGDPLTLSNIKEYLDLTYQKKMRVMFTTSGYYLQKHDPKTLLHPAIKQINLSLNSYNKNHMPFSFEEYMRPIITLCHSQQASKKDLFINLRVWNIDASQSEKAFNQMLFEYLEKEFQCTLHVKKIYEEKPRSIRLAERILLHFDTYFEWPSLSDSHHSHGRCLGLDSHFGILSNGTVTPCCLDKDGIVTLGNLHKTPLKQILEEERTQKIIDGFKKHHAVELLCQKCRYKERFKEK